MPGNGVPDPLGKTGFFPNTIGGIDALDLATGKVLWSSKEANRPLFATDIRLFAQRGATIHVLHTAENGKPVLEAKPLGFPAWVSVDVAYGRSFRSSVRVEGKTMWLSWEARAFYAGGAPPPPKLEKAARKEAAGVVRVDLDTGKVESLDAENIAAGEVLSNAAGRGQPQGWYVNPSVAGRPSEEFEEPIRETPDVASGE